MPLIDENGQVFGRVNLIDAAVGGLVFLLVPLAYVAYLLFQTPTPRFDPIAPITLTEGAELPLVGVTGEHMRPFLRVFVGGSEATYLFETPERAAVRLPQLRPGTYDLAFFDEALEIARQTGAITVSVPPPPPVQMTVVRLVGAFVGLSLEQARVLESDETAASAAAAGWGAEVVRTWTPEPDVTRFRDSTLPTSVLVGQYRVPAVLRVRCGFVDGSLRLLDGEGRVLGSDPRWKLPEETRRALAITIAEGAVLSIPGEVRHLLSNGAVSGDDVSFHVQHVQADPPAEPPLPAAVTRVRLVGAFTGLSPEQAQALQQDPAAARAMTAGWGAEILSVGAPESDVSVLRANNVPPSRLEGRQRVPAVLRVRSAVVDGTLRLLDDEGRVLGTDPDLDLSDEARGALVTTVAPGAVLSIPAAISKVGASGNPADRVVSFHVEEVYPDSTELIEVTARVITRPPIVELLRRSLAEPEPPPAFAALRPRLLEFEIEREVLGTTLDELRQGLTSILLASIRLPAVRTSSGWAYGNQHLKPGVDFYLETADYRVFCQVLAIEAP